MFEKSAKGGSELDAVIAAVKDLGVEAARLKFENHWRSALTDADMKFLTRSAHVNTIRLPIGYFTLGPQFCHKTPFSGKVAEVYTNAWSIALSIISLCASNGIGVLIDFHALPGGANKDDHSGTSADKAELWKSSSNLSLALKCLSFITNEVTMNPAVASGSITGIQVCNEAAWAAPGLYTFYDQAIETISSIDPTIPIYISDAWNLPECLSYTSRKNGLSNRSPSPPVIIDTHKYYTFSDDHRSKSPEEIIQLVQDPSKAFKSLESYTGSVFDHSSAVAIFVGEYSVTLDTQTWSRTNSDRGELTKSFGQTQSNLYNTHTLGSAYWSYKFDWGNHAPGPRGLVHTHGGDWGFRNQFDNQSISPPALLETCNDKSQVLHTLNRVSQRKEDLQAQAYNAHVSYWDSTVANPDPDKPFHHYLYSQGYDLGFSDAATFFASSATGLLPARPQASNDSTFHSVSKIGSLDLWILKRMRESGTGKDKDYGGWEWEQGFRKGVQDFEALVLGGNY
ncbi:putative glucanbeta-glucosidase [Phaeomoniella chlamydospora]|uniref:Putative glucanbeta-glucosidase n=1 Tax=Phaeomoniella chlamydospora TaxID=158046 RepID=A0A0G2ERB2_PHACM|nr:putative glucanbeta-glucosidase [Phaeomoniella chlamydospora]